MINHSLMYNDLFAFFNDSIPGITNYFPGMIDIENPPLGKCPMFVMGNPVEEVINLSSFNQPPIWKVKLPLMVVINQPNPNGINNPHTILGPIVDNILGRVLQARPPMTPLQGANALRLNLQPGSYIRWASIKYATSFKNQLNYVVFEIEIITT